MSARFLRAATVVLIVFSLLMAVFGAPLLFI